MSARRDGFHQGCRCIAVDGGPPLDDPPQNSVCLPFFVAIMPRQASSMSSLYPIVQDLTQEDYAGDCCCPSNLWAAKSEKLFRARNDKALMDTCDSLTQSTVGASGSFDDNYVLTRQVRARTFSF